MKKLLLASLLAACVSAPKDANDRDRYGVAPTLAAFKASVERSLERNLKDPASRRVTYSELRPMWVATRPSGFMKGTQQFFGHGMIVLVNAKNSLGGYVGDEPWLFLLTTDAEMKSWTGDIRQSSQLKWGHPD